MICTKRRLNGEIERIKKILPENGYPKNVISAQIAMKISQFSSFKRFGREKYPVYLRVLWIGKPSTNLEKEVKTAVGSCYGFVSTRFVNTSNRITSNTWHATMFYLPFKNVLSYMNTSATVTVGT